MTSNYSITVLQTRNFRM